MQNALELFAGSRSFGKVCDELNINTFSVDILKGPGVYVRDFFELGINEIPFVPDIIWASPPCTAFSVSSGGFHMKDGFPKTEVAIDGILLLKKTIFIINYYLKINPNLKFYIENPRGLMRKHLFMQDLEFYRKTIHYCQYGFNIQKPTDIWTNNIYWIPRPVCSPGSDCHESAPRNSKKGGLRGISKKNRSIIPSELFYDILLTKIPCT